MMRTAAAAILAASVLAPAPGWAFGCANCYNESTAIVQEIKRAIEFAKLLATAKQQAATELNTWRSVYEVRNFRSMTTALGNLSMTYYPQGMDAVQAMRDGQSLAGGGMSLDRLLSRSTMARLDRNFGNAEAWYDAMDERLRVVALGREAAGTAIQRSQQSIQALSAAESALAAKQGAAELAAAQGALQLASLNATHNRTQLEAVRMQMEAEALNIAARQEQRVRQADLAHAATYAAAFDRLRAARAP